MSDAPRTRLFLDTPLGLAMPIGLAPERAHFLRHVLRLEPGAEIAVFNGRDGEWLARIDGFGKGWCSLALVHQRREQTPPLDLWLLFAPIKRGRIDFVAEKACELGVSRIWPVFTRHTDPNRVNIARLQANAVEAAEQCERLCVPEVVEPVTLEAALAGWPSERTLHVCMEAGEVRPIAQAVAGKSGATAFLVGPEGGFSKSELDLLLGLSFVVPVGLGPRVLRADTAVVAALACWQALSGDWVQSGAEARPPSRGGL